MWKMDKTVDGRRDVGACEIMLEEPPSLGGILERWPPSLLFLASDTTSLVPRGYTPVYTHVHSAPCSDPEERDVWLFDTQRPSSIPPVSLSWGTVLMHRLCRKRTFA